MDAKQKMNLDNRMKVTEQEEILTGSKLNFDEEFNNLNKNEKEQVYNKLFSKPIIKINDKDLQMIKEEFILPHDEVMCLLIKHKGDANAAVQELLNNFQ